MTRPARPAARAACAACSHRLGRKATHCSSSSRAQAWPPVLRPAPRRQDVIVPPSCSALVNATRTHRYAAATSGCWSAVGRSCRHASRWSIPGVKELLRSSDQVTRWYRRSLLCPWREGWSSIACLNDRRKTRSLGAWRMCTLRGDRMERPWALQDCCWKCQGAQCVKAQLAATESIGHTTTRGMGAKHSSRKHLCSVLRPERQSWRGRQQLRRLPWQKQPMRAALRRRAARRPRQRGRALLQQRPQATWACGAP